MKCGECDMTHFRYLFTGVLPRCRLLSHCLTDLIRYDTAEVFGGYFLKKYSVHFPLFLNCYRKSAELLVQRYRGRERKANNGKIKGLPKNQANKKGCFILHPQRRYLSERLVPNRLLMNDSGSGKSSGYRFAYLYIGFTSPAILFVTPLRFRPPR